MNAVAPARKTKALGRIALIDLTREYGAYRSEFLAAVERVLDGMHLLNGEEGKAFEREMADYLGVRHVRGVASGTDALYLSILAAGLGPGDEVLIQANSFVAAAEALYRAGVRAVPVDIRLDDLGPDLGEVQAKFGERTRGILVVHLYGFPVDLEPIMAFAAARSVAVIEDCSHAHGATLNGQRVGSFGIAGAFSLGVVKNLAAYGDAGMISTDDEELAERVKLLGTHGQKGKNNHIFYGGNSRLDELHAAMLRVKLRHLEARNARRAEIAAYYTACLRGHVTTPCEDPARTHVYHQYVIRTTWREALKTHLQHYEIETGIHYPQPIHLQPAWKNVYGETPAMPRAEQAAREILSLPVHADLTDEEVEGVADAVVSFFK